MIKHLFSKCAYYCKSELISKHIHDHFILKNHTSLYCGSFAIYLKNLCVLAPGLCNFSLVISGIAFPCCISVNNCICHFTPLMGDADLILKEGDMAKIDMGAHIDGFIAVVAHTVVVGVDKVTGRQADALLAAHLASEAALRLVKPGNEVGIGLWGAPALNMVDT